MKLKFFLTILFIVAIAAVTVALVQTAFFDNERHRLLDQQIENNASILLSSGLSTAQLEDFEEADLIISELFGGTPINQVIVIYNPAGRVIYRNKNASLLKLYLPGLKTWETLKVEGHLLRLFTLPFPAKKRTLQVGLVMNQSLDQWEVLRHRVWRNLAWIMALILVISFVLATVLLNPIKQLALYLKDLTLHFETDFNKSSPSLSATSRLKASRGKDEFSQLTRAIRDLLDKVRETLRQTTARSAQLAHELKTPLTIIKNQLEALRPEVQGKSKIRVEESLQEIDHLNNTITAFLEWSLTEASPGAPADIHAIKLNSFLDHLVKSLSTIHPNRIELTQDPQDKTVFARPSHLDQVFTNLIVNALKYSPLESTVQIKVAGESVSIRDHGKGIAQSVIEKLGTPFNIGPSGSHMSKGTGLGLAWVYTICLKYHWPLHITPSTQGTTITVTLEPHPGT